MCYEEHLRYLKEIEETYRKTKIVDNGYVSCKGCRQATEREKFIIDAWNNKIELSNLTFIGEGKCSKVFLDDSKSFVVKIVKPDGIGINFNCYFELHKYTPHTTGYSSIESVSKSYRALRKIFLEHILYPTLISSDYLCCVQDYLIQDKDKTTNYLNKQLEEIDLGFMKKDISVFGPFENIAWSGSQAYIIDIW